MVFDFEDDVFNLVTTSNSNIEIFSTEDLENATNRLIELGLLSNELLESLIRFKLRIEVIFALEIAFALANDGYLEKVFDESPNIYEFIEERYLDTFGDLLTFEEIVTVTSDLLIEFNKDNKNIIGIASQIAPKLAKFIYIILNKWITDNVLELSDYFECSDGLNLIESCFNKATAEWELEELQKRDPADLAGILTANLLHILKGDPRVMFSWTITPMERYYANLARNFLFRMDYIHELPSTDSIIFWSKIYKQGIKMKEINGENDDNLCYN